MQREISNNVEWNQQFTTEEESMEEMVRLHCVEEDTICPKCGHGRACKLIRRGLWQCASRRNHVSSKVESLFKNNLVSANKWFVMILLMTSYKGYISAVRLLKMVQVSWRAVRRNLRRIRQAMCDLDECYLLQDLVDMDARLASGRQLNLSECGTEGKSKVMFGVTHGEFIGYMAVQQLERTNSLNEVRLLPTNSLFLKIFVIQHY